MITHTQNKDPETCKIPSHQRRIQFGLRDYLQLMETGTAHTTQHQKNKEPN